MAEYPSQLPAALQVGYRVQTVSPLIRTPLDSGRARQRRRFTSVPQMVTLEWILRNGEAQLFEAWFKFTITDGSDWFDMPVKTANGCQIEQVRFTDIYSGPSMISSQLLRYSAEVEIFERRTIDEEWLIAPDMLAGMDILDIAMNDEWPEP